MSARNRLVSAMNAAERVPAEYRVEDGQVWFHKLCPDCGSNASLISSDAAAWQAKRNLWEGAPLESAWLARSTATAARSATAWPCSSWTSRIAATWTARSAGSRCTAWALNSTRRWSISRRYCRRSPRCVPVRSSTSSAASRRCERTCSRSSTWGESSASTCRSPRMGYGWPTKSIAESSARRAWACGSPSTAATGEPTSGCNNGPAYDKKMLALQNLKKYSRRKHTIIACAATGINDEHLADLIQFCHENRQLVSDLGIIPLYENWKPGEFEVAGAHHGGRRREDGAKVRPRRRRRFHPGRHDALARSDAAVLQQAAGHGTAQLRRRASELRIDYLPDSRRRVRTAGSITT